ncbi:unnamed protein product, partial [Symbiodinium microadriaticum]
EPLPAPGCRGAECCAGGFRCGTALAADPFPASETPRGPPGSASPGSHCLQHGHGHPRARLTLGQRHRDLRSAAAAVPGAQRRLLNHRPA